STSENLDTVGTAIRQANRAQRGFINPSAVVKLIERIQIYRDIARAVARVVKPALGNAPDQRHLTAFEPDANRTAGAGGLALAAASAGFAVAGGFALAETLAAVFGPGSWFEIV